MTTPPNPPSRPAWWWVVIGGAIAVVVCAVISLVIVNLNDDPVAQDTTTQAAPQEPEPDYPTFTSPEATEETQPEVSPSATPTTAEPTPVPPDGDERGCPTADGGVDENDSYCTERDAKRKFAAYFKKHKVNGAWRFEVTENGKFRRVSLSPTNTIASLEAKVSDEAPTPELGVSGVEWVVRQSQFDTDDTGEFYRLRYFNNSRLKPYAVYYQVGTGIGNWKLAEPRNDLKFYTGTFYQLVVFWHDPEAPKSATPAPLPPAFSWDNVEKPSSF